ncbi:DUF397 domain-containing protein [Actinokineospora spheciospongiae]|nr:DUF397 domain-containing protein [Actinokineospora spheciospongiae]PWW64675.1 uncharacterized protein DUF397 [Actinokineospora spheciospongiae]
MTIDAEFRRSSFCSNGNCVQVAMLADGRVALRDSKNPAAPAHVLPARAWTRFNAAIKGDAVGCPAG